ncbi:MAG: TIR domain-containing protein [Pseudomonadota bacterium]
MSGIFISYRREDSSGFSGRLFDRLSAHFGRSHVFMDIEALRGGEDFVDAIDKALESCDALIVIIGSEWLSASNSQGRRRLENPHDFIRLEVGNALRRKLLVIPVLVDGAEMPTADELPADLASLARRQAVELSNTRWDFDVNRLIETLELRLGPGDGPSPPPPPWRWLRIASVFVVLAAMAWGGFTWWSNMRPTPADQPATVEPVTDPPGSQAEGTPAGPGTDVEPPGHEEAERQAQLERQREQEQAEAARREEQEKQRAKQRRAEEEALRQQEAEREARSRAIAELLALAEGDITARRLTTPAGNNAHERYQAILEMAPDHPEALDGLKRIGHRYLEMAEENLAQGHASRSLRYIAKAEPFVPDDPRLEALREQAEKVKAAQAPPPVSPKTECLRGCSARLAACRERQGPFDLSGCLRQGVKRCESRLEKCPSDPQILFVWGELGVDSACHTEYTDCRQMVNTACKRRESAHGEACKQEALECRRGC